MGYEWRIKKHYHIGKILENQTLAGDKTNKGNHGAQYYQKEQKGIGGYYWMRCICQNHNSGWNSRCPLTWLFTSQGFYPFMPRVRVQESEEFPEVEEEKVRMSWEKSVSYFLFSLINHPGEGERKHTVKMQVKPHDEDAVNTLEARACYSKDFDKIEECGKL